MTCTPECGQKLIYCFSRDCGRAARQAEAACANTLHQNEPCKRAGSRQRCLTQLCMSRFPPTELGGRALTSTAVSFQSLQACFQAHALGTPPPFRVEAGNMPRAFFRCTRSFSNAKRNCPGLLLMMVRIGMVYNVLHVRKWPSPLKMART